MFDFFARTKNENTTIFIKYFSLHFIYTYFELEIINYKIIYFDVSKTRIFLVLIYTG